jgi:hypothetical protein
MRQTRRKLLLGGAGVIATGLAGYGVSAGGGESAPAERAAIGRDSTIRPHGEVPGTADGHVEYVRNVEEVKGHLTSSADLLAADRPEDAALHAGHASDYFETVLTPLRDADHGLATRLRGHLKEPAERVESTDAESYREYLTGELFPVLDRAVEAVVPAEERSTTAFTVRVTNALAGRLAEEYTAAVDERGTIRLAGEYWDGRGFLSRIEHHHGRVAGALGDAGAEDLATLRSRVEAIEPPAAVRAASLRYRVATTAAADLPAAHVEDRADALEYVRNLEEIHGHLAASATLAAAGDESAAALHAGHPGDYVTALAPAARRADPALADRLVDRLLAADARLADGTDAYERFVSREVAPTLDEVRSAVVPERYRSSTSFGAAVIVALARRIEDEYTAAVTDDEVIELYGEYWDARGFLTRIEARFEEIRGDLDAPVRDELAEELAIVRTELETAATPDDLSGSVAAIERILGEVAEA